MTIPTSRDQFVLVDGNPSMVRRAPSEQSEPDGVDFSFLDTNSLGEVRVAVMLKQKFPDHVLAIVPTFNCDLLNFVVNGHATAIIDDKTTPFISTQGFTSNGIPNEPGRLVERIDFAKYDYTWKGNKFIVITLAMNQNQGSHYILRLPEEGEVEDCKSRVTNDLIQAVGQSQIPKDKVVYVFDGSWSRNKQLYGEVEQASWNDVVLNPDMKKAMTDIIGKFFDSESVYKELGVAWKRGLLLHGPPGNGKSLTIKAIMKSLYLRETPVPTLYVKSCTNTNAIQTVFTLARRMAPCLLILEDIETIVTEYTRSYFFNEVDGLERNDGILMIGTTNHLEDLDAGLSKRPNRFDRKYLFPLPSEVERTLYCEYWTTKLAANPSLEFPVSICSSIAKVTEGFSFAYMKELFLTTLLVIAQTRSDAKMGITEESSYTQHSDFWYVIEREAKNLREDMESTKKAAGEATGVLRTGGRGGPMGRGPRHPPPPLGQEQVWNPFSAQEIGLSNAVIPANLRNC